TISGFLTKSCQPTVHSRGPYRVRPHLQTYRQQLEQSLPPYWFCQRVHRHLPFGGSARRLHSECRHYWLTEWPDCRVLSSPAWVGRIKVSPTHANLESLRWGLHRP